MAEIVDPRDLFIYPRLYSPDWQWSLTDLERPLQPAEYLLPPATSARDTRHHSILENTYHRPLTFALITAMPFQSAPPPSSAVTWAPPIHTQALLP